MIIKPRTSLFALLALLVLAGCGSSPESPATPAADTRSKPGSESLETGWWKPHPGVSWQWQLSGRIDTSVRASVYDVDMFDTPASTVATLHRMGRKVICYIDAGAAEQGRPDYRKFPKSVLGKRLDGWPQERWLDIRRLSVLRPIWTARLDECKKKGFDGVEPDNMDAYQAKSGFPLTAAEQLTFDRMLASTAHARGLAVGLKNDVEQVPQLVRDVDFSVDEQCAEYQECPALTPFIRQGKAVFHAEYTLPPKKFCAESKRLHLSSIRKTLDLTAWRQTCP